MNPLVASVIRTYTPTIVGQIVAWLVLIHIPVQPDLEVLVTAAVGGALTLAYYTLVRVLEQQWPAAGFLLGLPRSPDTYSKATATAATPANPTQQPVLDYPETPRTAAPAATEPTPPPSPSSFSLLQAKLAASAPEPETAPPAPAQAPDVTVVVAPAAVSTPEPTPAEKYDSLAATGVLPPRQLATEATPAPVNTPVP